MCTLNEFEEILNNKKESIKDVYSFLECYLTEKISLDFFVAYMQLIVEHNKKIVEEKKEKLNAVEEFMSIDEEKEMKKVEDSSKQNGRESRVIKKESQDYEDLISKLGKEENLVGQILPKFDEQSIKEIKLAIYRKILLLEKDMKESIIEDPSKSILSLQQKYLQLQKILREVINFAKPKEEENLITESTTKSKIKIFFLPNGKGSTYFAEDILGFVEKREEVENALNKIVDGYFLKTKDTKPIQGTKEKLFEYTNPNGIRILFMVMKENTYAICSLFYKDKNKSKRITEYYEEAVRRFKKQRSYIEDNVNDPNLYIEQAELLGELYTILESNTQVLKEVF